jgi:16S rRNA (uracil1498-N3)-methyltransferase
MSEDVNETALAEAGGKTRLYVTGDLGEGVTVTLDEGQDHYLLHVLRAKTAATANGWRRLSR